MEQLQVFHRYHLMNFIAGVGANHPFMPCVLADVEPWVSGKWLRRTTLVAHKVSVMATRTVLNGRFAAPARGPVLTQARRAIERTGKILCRYQEK